MTIDVTQQDQLTACMQAFKAQLTRNTRAKKLIQNWNRTILIDSTDTPTKIVMTVANTEITDIRPAPQNLDDLDDGNLIHVQATQDILIDIFSGRYNPANALIDGALAIFSPERDKVKLEAIAMVVWGD